MICKGCKNAYTIKYIPCAFDKVYWRSNLRYLAREVFWEAASDRATSIYGCEFACPKCQHRWSSDNKWATLLNRLGQRVECCASCGVVRRADKKNSLICKGPAKIGLRTTYATAK